MAVNGKRVGQIVPAAGGEPPTRRHHRAARGEGGYFAAAPFAKSPATVLISLRAYRGKPALIE